MDSDLSAGCNEAAAGEGARPATLIERYEEIARESHRMLEAAHAGDWHEVERIETHCRALIVLLKRHHCGELLSPAERRRRMALLRAILDDDAQIRVRAEPWLRELENFLGAPPPAAAQD